MAESSRRPHLDLDRRRFLGLAGGVTAAGLLAACGGKDPATGGAAASKVDSLSMWNGTFAAFGKGTDTTKKKDDYWLAQAITAFQAEHGATIKVDNTAEGPDLLTKLRTSGVARKGPDLATIWSGTYLLSIKDYLAPLSDSYPTDKRNGIVGWESVTEGLVDGAASSTARRVGQTPSPVSTTTRRCWTAPASRSISTRCRSGTSSSGCSTRSSRPASRRWR